MIHYEPGLYQCRVTEQGWQTSKTNKEMLVFKIRPDYRIVKDGAGNEQFEDAIDDPRNSERTLRIVLDPSNDKMMEFALKKLRVCGFEGTSFSDLNLVGSDVRAVCDHDEYNGKDVEQWDFHLPFQAEEIKPIDASQARKLDALFGKRLKGAPASEKDAPRPLPKPSPTKETVPPEDEVPF